MPPGKLAAMPRVSFDGDMNVRILGDLAVLRGTDSSNLGGYKQRSLLGFLLVNQLDWMTPSQCIEAVWGESPPDGAIKSLQTYVFNLRKILEPAHEKGQPWDRLQSSDRGYRISENVTTDVEEFRKLVELARRARDNGRIDEALELATKAVEHYSGDPLGDLGGEHWALAFVNRLREEWLDVLDLQIQAELAFAHHEDLIPRLEEMVERNPLRESTWGHLMLALYRSGRQADALRTFQRLSRHLGEELGIEPGPEVTALEQRILEHDPSLDLPKSSKGNIPAPITNLVGRSAERSQIADLADVSRLLTIMGPPGAGKTRLAIETALDLAHRYPDGVWMVEMAPLATSAQMWAELFGSLGVGNPPDMTPGEIVDASLSTKKTLIVLDNCEHMVDEVITLIRTVLGRSQDIRIIATSRRALGIPGEVTLTIPGLSIEATTGPSEAASMFIDRVTEIDPTLDLTDRLETVEAIVARLDGLPLAIELAAARMRVLDVESLLQRMEHRFETLASGTHAGGHHRSLRRLVDWSYDLLTADQQKAYRWIAAFPGGCNPTSMGHIVEQAGLAPEATLELVDALVSSSLLVIERGAAGTRYRMLETIREHALGELRDSGEENAALQAQFDWVRDFSWSNKQRLASAEGKEALAEGLAEADNMQAAMNWAIASDPASAVRLGTTLSQFWWMSGMAPVRSDLSRQTCYMILGADLQERALNAAAGAIDAKTRARALTALGGVLSIRTGKVEDAVDQLSEAIELSERIGDKKGEAWARYYKALATSSLTREPLQLATGAAVDVEGNDRAIALFEEIGEPYGEALAKLNLVGVPGLLEYDEAGRLLDEIDESPGGQIPVVKAHLFEIRSLRTIVEGDLEKAADELMNSLALLCQLGPATCITHAITSVALHQQAAGEPRSAAEFVGAAESIRRRFSMVVARYEDRSDWVDLSSLNEQEKAEAQATGRSWSLQTALDTAAVRMGHDPAPLQMG